jgi:protein involved in polysaccharide export with SLBB domain
MIRRALLLAWLGAAAGATPGAEANDLPSNRELLYRVGPGDVLEVVVDGRPDLSRLPTVQTTGTIHHPLLGDVPVADLSVADVLTRVATLLAKEGVANPVRLRVREYNSRSVFVAGEVARPGRKALKAGGRLIDALVDAGGFAATASGEVLVQRRDGTFDDGTTIKRFRFRSSGPSAEDRLNLSLALHPGDVVTSRPRQFVMVSGEVGRPGRYELSDGMTVTDALEAAGGVARSSYPKVSLERAQPAEGEPRKVDVDTRAVRSGEASDPTLRANDTVSVRARKL